IVWESSRGWLPLPRGRDHEPPLEACVEPPSEEAAGACAAVLIESSELLLDELLWETAALAAEVLPCSARPRARAPVPRAAATEAVIARTRRRPRRRWSNGSGGVGEKVTSASVAPGCRRAPWRHCDPSVGPPGLAVLPGHSLGGGADRSTELRRVRCRSPLQGASGHRGGHMTGPSRPDVVHTDNGRLHLTEEEQASENSVVHHLSV